MTPRYSLIMPLYNEAGNILPLLTDAFAVLATLSGEAEVILIDDGSTDATASEIVTALARWPQCRVITHPRNLGQNVALLDGLRDARGKFLLTMDGDGQNDPRDFPLLLAAVEGGPLDVACGWRTVRKDPVLRRIMSLVANEVRRRVLHDDLHDAGCQLRVLRSTVVAALFPFEMLQTFLPAIAVSAGYQIGEFPVRHHPRVHGQAHFGFGQLWWKPMVAMLRLRRRLNR
jgi:dolichol-phosphate mannosyltransferase